MTELEHTVDPRRVEAVRASRLSATEAEHLGGLRPEFSADGIVDA